MLNHVRNSLRSVVAAILASILCAPTFAADYPACPALPEPAVWNGTPAAKVDRDIESCLYFEPYQWNELFGIVFYRWWPHDLTQLHNAIRAGYRIEVTDRFLAGVPTTAVEFLNTDLNHYFLALPDEARAIEDGKAGSGWKRTGYDFPVRQVTYDPFPGKHMEYNSPLSTEVYRFYGSTSPGPNSHFFTADRVEQNGLAWLARVSPADQPRWNPEGIAFNAFRKDNSGDCPAGKAPVWRAFNGGAARGLDPNHRYSPDRAVIDGMLSQGWVGEGVAFCVDATQ